jgi:hypothetical protein
MCVLVERDKRALPLVRNLVGEVYLPASNELSGREL